MNRKTHRARCSGLTLIELITALALFVLVFALLMTVLRFASHLWVPDQSDQQLQACGDTVMDILANDYYQAIADRGVIPLSGKTNEPTFVLDCNTNTLSTAVEDARVVLYFARHASSKMLTDDPLRTSLDAVYYVLYRNCLSRHVYPVVHAAWENNTQTLGDFLLEGHDFLLGEIDTIYNTFETGIGASTLVGSHSLLAERCEFAAVAALPPTMLKEVLVTDETLVVLDQCEAYAVPDFLDVALMLYSEADWKALNTLLDNGGASTDDERMKLEFLGKPFSKRIVYPAKGGARL